MKDSLLNRLDELGVDVETAMEMRFMNDEETYRECLLNFIEDPSMGNLEAAVKSRDDQLAIRSVHMLKGIADTLGFLSLFDEANDMLNAFRADRGLSAYAMLPDVRREYNAVVDAIKPFV